MKIQETTPQQITVLACAVAMISLLILCVDFGIKRQILREAMQLREVINGYASGGSQVRGSQAGSDNAVRDTDNGFRYGDHAAGLSPNAADARGGGIKSAPVLGSPQSRAYLNGDRTDDGAADVRAAFSPFPSEGYGIPEIQGGI